MTHKLRTMHQTEGISYYQYPYKCKKKQNFIKNYVGTIGLHRRLENTFMVLWKDERQKRKLMYWNNQDQIQRTHILLQHLLQLLIKESTEEISRKFIMILFRVIINILRTWQMIIAFRPTIKRTKWTAQWSELVLIALI